MKILIIVTLLCPWLASSKNLPWSKKLIKSYHNQTLAQICQNSSKRLQEKVCSGIKKDLLKEKTKFKWVLEERDTVLIRYKNYSTKIKRTDSHLIYLVNRRSLYLEEVTGARDLQNKIKKLLPRPEKAGTFWISAAYADDFPVEEFSRAMTLLLFQNDEHETCTRAESLIKACNKFDEKFIEKSKEDCKKDPKNFENRINGPRAMQNIKTLVASAQNFTNFYSPLNSSRTENLKKCECKEGLCKIGDQETQIGKDFKTCQSNMATISKLNEKCGDVDFPVVDAIKELKSVTQRQASDEPKLFREDSYRENNQ